MHKNTIVIYISKTGFTQQYAYDIAVDLQAEMIAWDRFDFDMLRAFDTVIFGSRIIAEQIQKINEIKYYAKTFPDINFVLFVTGATPASATKVIDKMWRENLTFMEDTLPHFYLPSGLNYEQMNKLEKLMLKTFTASMKLKPKKTEKDLAQIEKMTESFDERSYEYIEPLLEYVKSLPSYESNS